MRSTLFYIPAEVAGVPVFGFGWLLGAWIVFCLGVLAWLARQPEGRRELGGYALFMAVIAGVIVWLLPRLVEYGPGNEPLGLPIRAWGVVLMLAIVLPVGLASHRGRQVGVAPEAIQTLALIMVVAGLIGARLFFLLQYWHEFVRFTPQQAIDLPATLAAMVDVTKGGMVVYGSVIAGVPAGVWYLRNRGLPILAVGDIIAPSMALGLAIGRIGCFLNGCCFGGVCLTADYAVTFPGGREPSPPYQQHVEAGWHSGVWLRPAEGDKVVVAYVAPDSAAEAAGVMPGLEISAINGKEVASVEEARQILKVAAAMGRPDYEISAGDGEVLHWRATAPPRRSVPVHPAQLYAAIDAGLLALLLWVVYPFRRRDGEVFALLLTIHPVSRFLLELIRSDEPGQFGTALTISQWLSLGILGVAAILWWYIEHQPRGNLLPREVTTKVGM